MERPAAPMGAPQAGAASQFKFSSPTEVIETPLGTLAVSASNDGEYFDLYVDIKRGGEVAQVAVITVDSDGLHVLPFSGVHDDTHDRADVALGDDTNWYPIGRGQQ